MLRHRPRERLARRRSRCHGLAVAHEREELIVATSPVAAMRGAGSAALPVGASAGAGSASEIVDQGVTGAIVDTMEEAVRMLPRVIALDRHAVRRRFEQRFSSARMATDYVAIFSLLLERSSISERETIVPLPRPVLERKLNGQGPHGDRARRAAGTGSREHPKQ
jgi:hypothetical protein